MYHPSSGPDDVSFLPSIWSSWWWGSPTTGAMPKSTECSGICADTSTGSVKLVISHYKTSPGACSSLLQMTKNENMLLLIMYYSVRARLSVSQARCGTGSHSSCELQLLLYKTKFILWRKNDSCSSCLLPAKKRWIPSTSNDFGKERASPSVNFLSGHPKGRWHFFVLFIFTEQVV